MKKILSIILSLIMLVSLTTGLDFSSYAEANQTFLFGDVNADGTIDFINDVTQINNFVLGNITFTDEQKIIADVNGDGIVDNIDMDLVNEFRLGNVSQNDLPVYDSISSQGYCGKTAKYILYNTGRLVIFGSGDIENYSYYGSGTSPFYNNSFINEILIRDDITSIGEYVFNGCSSITSVTIPNSVTGIGRETFRGCSRLTSIEIPSNVTNIGNWIFCECSSLTSITVDSSNKNYSSQDGVLFNKNKTILIQYPIGNTRTSYAVPNSVTSIGKWAFRDCDRLTSVTIPDDVMLIDYMCFFGCDSLTNVTIPNNVISIGMYAFCECDSLTNVTIGNSVTSIGNSAFNSCRNLIYVNYAGTMEQWNKISIGDYNLPLTSAQINCTDGVINEHIHSYDSGRITKFATCTADGVRTYTCTKCNAIKTEAIAKTGHNYTARTYQPTCTENGYVRHQCQNCNDAYVSDYVSPTGHSAGTSVRENIVEATVLTDGSYDEVVYCENCNVQLSRQHKTIPKNSNTISVGETKTAQILEAGKYTYYVFAPTKSEKLKFFSTSNNDTYGYLYDADMNEITNDDDSGDGNNFCIEYNFEAGKTYVFGCRYYSSSNTGSFDVKLEKSHIHSYSETITYPTCTDRGYTTYACACGDNYVDNYVNATGHSYNSGRITKSATCTADGEKTYTCTKCGATKKEMIAKTGHKYSTQIVNPTCTDGGYTKHICIWCGDEYCDNQTKAIGHTWRKSETVKPTCLSDGYTFYKCADCNEGYMGDYVSATGHDYDNGKVIMYQTCTADGAKRYTCKNCSHTYDVSIEAMGHDYYTNTVEPTCECDGYKEYVCSRCGDGYIDYMIPATGHIYNSGRITKSPTCESYGEKTYTCYNCGDTTTEQIPKMNHIYSSKYISPTCTDDGYTLYTCSYCGYNYRTNYISAKGHSYDSGKITKQPTCTSYGEKTYTCYYCPHTKTESVYPTGHRYTSKKVASTCTKQGYTLYTCTKCNSSYTGNYTALKAHSDKTYTTKATLSKNGSVVTKCSVCNKTTITTIYYPKIIALSKTSYTYNGKVQKPAVIVKDSNGKVIGAGNYTVAYPSGMKNIGQYTVKITFKGNYSGSVTKTFTIIPKPIDFSSVKSPKKSKVELKWKKASGITGYQVQISSKSNFAAKSTKTLSFKQSKTSTTGKLASKKTHYFRIRTYKTVKVNGKNTNIYSAWSKTKSVKVK